MPAGTCRFYSNLIAFIVNNGFFVLYLRWRNEDFKGMKPTRRAPRCRQATKHLLAGLLIAGALLHGRLIAEAAGTQSSPAGTAPSSKPSATTKPVSYAGVASPAPAATPTPLFTYYGVVREYYFGRTN